MIESTAPGRVIVVGSINEDTQFDVPHHLAPGETLAATAVRTSLGGKGLNQTVAARRAGADTVMVGAVGDDAPGASAMTFLRAEGVDARLLVTSERTGMAMVSVDPAGENAILIVAGANGALAATEITERLHDLRPSDVVLLQLELPEASVRAATNAARAAGSRVVVNAAPYRSDAAELVERVDLLVVNATEALALNPAASEPVEAARQIAARAGTAVLVTLGGDGSVLCTPGDEHRVDAVATTVVDTTAAGDTYCGYLAAGLARGQEVTEAMRAASAAAAIAVSRRGATASVPTAAEVEARL